MPTDPVSSDILITLTGDVVAAHVSHNQVLVGDVPRLIETVFGALAALGKSATPEPMREPAVPLRASVKPGHVTCLECGRRMKVLKRHLMTDHALTPGDYRARWRLGADHPLVAPDYAKRRGELAKKIGRGRKSGQKVVRRRKAG
jgi:predicted transcriptional regulator